MFIIPGLAQDQIIWLVREVFGRTDGFSEDGGTSCRAAVQKGAVDELYPRNRKGRKTTVCCSVSIGETIAFIFQ